VHSETALARGYDTDLTGVPTDRDSKPLLDRRVSAYVATGDGVVLRKRVAAFTHDLLAHVDPRRWMQQPAMIAVA
jgi:hypothetical protein